MFVLHIFGVSALAVIARAATPSPGCNGTTPIDQEPGNTYDGTIGSRSYRVFIPPEYAPTAPSAAIISYHGATKTPEEQQGLDQFTNPDYNTDKIVVYPAGTPKDGCDDDGSCDSLYWEVDPDITTDDIQFTKDLLDSLEETYCLDLDRLYATGKSQGGGFVGQLAACESELSTRFAAFAPVSGAFYIDADQCEPADELLIPCEPGRENVPMIEFHGGADTTVAYDGGERKGACLPGIRHWVEEWAIRDGLSTEAETSELSDDAPNTTIFKYGGGLVSHVYAPDVEHDWPSTQENDDNQDSAPAEYDATPIILTFFDDHPLNN